MTQNPLDAATIQNLKSLSIKSKTQMYEWCREVFNVSTYFGNMPRTQNEVKKLANEIFSDLAGDIMEQLIAQLKESMPENSEEAGALAEILIPYHLENEGMTKGAAELVKLVDTVHGLRRAA